MSEQTFVLEGVPDGIFRRIRLKDSTLADQAEVKFLEWTQEESHRQKTTRIRIKLRLTNDKSLIEDPGDNPQLLDNDVYFLLLFTAGDGDKGIPVKVIAIDFTEKNIIETDISTNEYQPPVLH